MHLSELSHPNQLHGLSTAELEAIARQIRERHLEVVSTSGGHLGPGLGASPQGRQITLYYCINTIIKP